jgi:hypothetical protein
MIIFDENNLPTIVDSIFGPTISEYMWALDLNIMDFTLAPLVMLEETVCPAIQVQIRGYEFCLPAHWSILVYDQDTTQLDVVQLCETGGREFVSFVYGPTKSFPVPGIITATDYFPEFVHVSPSLNKHQMIACAVGADEFVLVSPSDSFNKFLKNTTIGDLIGS